MDWMMAAAGFVVGTVVGLTGMGGGALMTPMLVLGFGVQPLAAVSSDLLASFVMKPVGSLVHLRRGTVHLKMVGWLMLGSVPSAFTGVLILKSLGDSAQIQQAVKVSLGAALLLATAGLVTKAYLQMRDVARRRRGELPPAPSANAPVPVRPLATVLVGILGGLVVGMTSVGSGSLMIIALMALYPALSASRLVGTDLVQAVPLVGAAALGHAAYGDLQLDVTAALLVGAIPGVYLGSRVSSRAPQGVVRRALTLVLIASGLKLLGLDTVALAWSIAAVCVAGPLLWAWARTRHGLAPLARLERRPSRQPAPAAR
ncbi:MAG TPA: sulfite exporter TauE/SafE family protein [Mycobacteriales bacterium]|jgi:hypothetical protein|nr:sulfite exporter TauE/SafE family protein [Mycobacteriales bacterium]